MRNQTFLPARGWALIFAVTLLALTSFSPALEAQSGVTYTLDSNESFWTTGCQGPSPCLCPIFLGTALEGSLRLVPLAPSIGPIFEYTVEDFSVTKNEEGVITEYVGSGLLTIDLIAQTQQMTLNLDVNGVPQTFETFGIVPLPGNINDGFAIPVFFQINTCIYDGLIIVADAQTGTNFVRGDVNQDSTIDIADPVSMLNIIFGVTPGFSCFDAIDANDDGDANIADPVYLLANLFSGGNPPSAPFPNCGVDPTADALDCAQSGACP